MLSGKVKDKKTGKGISLIVRELKPPHVDVSEDDIRPVIDVQGIFGDRGSN